MRGLSIVGWGSAFLTVTRSADTSAHRLQRPITAGEQGSMPQRCLSVLTSTPCNRHTLSPPPRHLASGDASVTIRPLMLALAQRVSQL